MNRLTKNNYHDDLFELQKTRKVKVDEHTEIGYSQHRYNNDLWNKVKTIEDIEEELGIDLITIFKALKNSIYVKDCFGRIRHHICRGIDLESIIVIDNDCNYPECDFNSYFNEYRETWALTEEELRKDKSK